MRKHVAVALFTIAVFVVSLGVSVAHHHEDDVCPHADCALCLLLIQPVVSDGLNHSPGFALPVSWTILLLQARLFIPVCAGTVFLSRAPPFCLI